MASSYALPPLPTTESHFHAGHAHSHSYSHSYSHDTHHHHHARSHSSLQPFQDASTHFSASNASKGLAKKSSASLSSANGHLYTHREVSRETSPLNSPHHDHFAALNSFQHTAAVEQTNSHINRHIHADHPDVQPLHSPSHSQGELMKSRPRGESDLGRSASSIYRNVPSASVSWFSLPEALTSLLIPLPYIFASAAYHPGSAFAEDGLPPLSAYARLQKSVLEDQSASTTRNLEKEGSAFLEACTLTSGTLLLVAILAKIRSSERMLDRRKDKVDTSTTSLSGLLTPAAGRKFVLRSLSVGLPFYACTQLGGMRTGLVTLVAAACGLTSSYAADRSVLFDWRHILSSRKGSLAVMLFAMALDFAGITYKASPGDLAMGYLALFCSALLLPPPLPHSTTAPSQISGASSRPPWVQHAASSVLVSSVEDVNTTFASGILMSILTIFASFILSTSPPITTSAIAFSTLALASSAAAILFAVPSTLRSRHKAGLGVGCLVLATCAFLFSPSFWPGTIVNGGISGLSYFGVLYDTSSGESKSHNEDHAYEHAHNAHIHHHHQDKKYSWFTKRLIETCEPGSLVHGILSEKDSRRIAYFTCLNFGFMIVQGIYGYLSGSLGLLSDTVHMFFDCLGLVVGLGAAVASKWPTSPERPYGWGKLNVLAGFGNGIFLMLVSVEFAWEAVEGMLEGKELRHVEELLVVSTLGFLVNMVGLFAFGHAHAGHDHGHSHTHSHSHSHTLEHSHGHGHEHEHDHNHAHGHGHVHDLDRDHSHSQQSSWDSNHRHLDEHSLPNGSIHEYEHKLEHVKQAHLHDHDHHSHNENMHGIFLHVAADAGGSAAVIISTALTLWKPWYLWDPLATIIIAVLIFAAAVPLVTSSGQKLLLVIPDDLEYNIKNTLQALGELRGVVGYAVPRFWLDDKDDAGDSPGHHHHGHDHGPKGRDKIMGVIHIIADPATDLDDVRHRVDDFFHDRNIDVLVHVEREGEGQCWCGGGHWGSGSQ